MQDKNMILHKKRRKAGFVPVQTTENEKYILTNIKNGITLHP